MADMSADVSYVLAMTGKLMTAEELTRWEDHFREMERLCTITRRSCRSIASVLEQYKHASRDQWSSVAFLDSLLNKLREQVYTAQEVRWRMKSQALYHDDLMAMLNVVDALDVMHHYHADPNIDAYVIALFDPDRRRLSTLGAGSSSSVPAENATASSSTSTAPPQPPSPSPPPAGASDWKPICVVCFEETPPDTVPRPLSENTVVVSMSCCRQIVCRECLDRFWDTNNDNKIACPVCRTPIAG